MFTIPTYIVLDIPVPAADEVLSLRSRYDESMAQLPVEITIAGSSGIGTLAAEQGPETAFKAIQSVAQRHLPLVSAFTSVERFAGAPVFWLKPRDRAPFDALHNDLIAEGLKFNPSQFVFNPHCTISAKAQLSSRQESELLKSKFPQYEFSMSRLSIYQFIEGHASLIRSFGPVV